MNNQQKSSNSLSIVSINNHDGWIRLMYRFNGQRKGFNIGLRYESSNIEIAQKIAIQLENDIIFNRFDGNTKKYRVDYDFNKSETIKFVENNNTNNIIGFPDLKPAFTLKDAWETYKQLSKDRIALATQKRFWPKRDNLIKLLEVNNLLNINDVDKVLQFLLKEYSYSTIRNHFADFRAAINLAIDLGKYDGKNTYSVILKTFPKSEKKYPQSYTQEEVRIILDAFRINKYSNNKSAYPDSYYADLVEFRFLAGVRPSEAAALQWTDLITDNGKTWIITRKAYRDGCLQLYTKTKEIRVYPCFSQVLEFLERLPKIENQNNLIFPSIKTKGYLNMDNFSKRQWIRVVRDGLFKDGLISKYLPFYDERHTCGTLLLQSGIDIATIARILGNSPKVLMEHYLASREELNDLKDIF